MNEGGGPQKNVQRFSSLSLFPLCVDHDNEHTHTHMYTHTHTHTQLHTYERRACLPCSSSVHSTVFLVLLHMCCPSVPLFPSFLRRNVPLPTLLRETVVSALCTSEYAKAQ